MRNNSLWLGIAALGVLQYMGPRPLFVRTAYAAEVAAPLPATAMDASGPGLDVIRSGSNGPAVVKPADLQTTVGITLEFQASFAIEAAGR